ncbi:uncharacterized protein At5g08430-like isoform X3 [Tasmannia lanceolata]|uniref:uncharacterized protein At5g08430-like isoform X3 n=1 Tax=Tasmannia lanceolata TaxID=3420 RepID=UPI0040637E6E
MKRGRKKKEEIAEDYCFMCKDGGLLLVCEYKHCLKAYHPECVGKDNTFLETKDRWICDWHTCFICHKDSKFQCFCCPSSICRGCIKVAEFVHVKRKKGFCNNCLKLALLIEENVDVDSDGGKIDFADRETYEFLFKEYWELLKEKEGLSLEDLHKADELLKKGENREDGFSSDKDEEAVISDVDDMDNEIDDRVPIVEEYEGQSLWMKRTLKRINSRKEAFIGWGSKKLIEFLTSIGKNTEEPASPFEVCEIIQDYIRENNLIDPRKKKKVLCDARLHSLFGRKSVNRLKIPNLLEGHFIENQISESESEDENVSMGHKRLRRSSSNGKTHESVPYTPMEKIPEVPKYCYASVTKSNIELVYLRRSLVANFLKNPETFENNVTDCFVRVKSDPKDYYSKNPFQLLQVTGVKRVSEAYRIGDTSTDIVLQVSNMVRDIRLSMVSDDDFSEEECEDLRQRVNTGLLKRPTLVELDQKARSLHEDLTNHWIDREIVKLKNQIDRANEKGWRRELFEYIEKKRLLQTPAERSRLLKELPKVVADTEIVPEATPDCMKDAERVNEGNGTVFNDIAGEEDEGNGAVPPQKARKRGRPKGKGTFWDEIDAEEDEGKGACFDQIGVESDIEAGNIVDSPQKVGETGSGELNGVDSPQKVGETGSGGNEAAFIEKVVEIESKADIGAALTVPGSLDVGDAEAIKEKAVRMESDGIGTAIVASGPLDTGIGTASVASQPHDMEVEETSRGKDVFGLFVEAEHQSADIKDSTKENNIIDLVDSDDEDLVSGVTKMDSKVKFIDLDDDNEDVENDSVENHVLWHYVDPSGHIQGPFSMATLRLWKSKNYFDEEFKVWKMGQSREDAVLLTDALRMTEFKKIF